MHTVVHFIIANAIFTQVTGMQKVISWYGETIIVPCNNGNKPTDLMFNKWKLIKDDGTSEDLLMKQAQKDDAKILTRDNYKDRISTAANSSLLISQATLTDQRVFTCIMVSMSDLTEHPVRVEVWKSPSAPQITNKLCQMENDKLILMGECVTTNANPPAEIIWLKNNKSLINDDKTIIIQSKVLVDSVTGLSSTSSHLQYTTGKQDIISQFTCLVRHVTGPHKVTAPVTFGTHLSSNNVLHIAISPAVVIVLLLVFYLTMKLQNRGLSVTGLEKMSDYTTAEYRTRSESCSQDKPTENPESADFCYLLHR